MFLRINDSLVVNVDRIDALKIKPIYIGKDSYWIYVGGFQHEVSSEEYGRIKNYLYREGKVNSIYEK